MYSFFISYTKKNQLSCFLIKQQADFKYLLKQHTMGFVLP